MPKNEEVGMKDTLMKKGLAVLLSASMALTAVPLPAFAEEAADDEVIVVDSAAEGEEAELSDVSENELDAALIEDLDATLAVEEEIVPEEEIVVEEETVEDELDAQAAEEAEPVAEEEAEAELSDVSDEAILEAINGVDIFSSAMESQAEDGFIVKFGTLYSGRFVKGKYTSTAGAAYNYVRNYGISMSKKGMIKFDFSGSMNSDDFNKIDFIDISKVGNNNSLTKVWSSKGKLKRSGGKISIHEFVNLDRGGYILSIGFSHGMVGTPKSEWFGAFNFRVSKALFKDVLSGAWYYDVVEKAVDYGLMSGYKGSKAGYFGSNDKVTRGQVAVVLYNMAGKPSVGSGAKNFSDVKKGAFYYTAVRWASANDIVSGYGGNKKGKFGPNDKVTREQLAVMLANYAERWEGANVVGSASNYSKMKDKGSVSGYARKAVGWCFKKGILSGSKGKINPKSGATRAETSKMMVVLYEMLY